LLPSETRKRAEEQRLHACEPLPRGATGLVRTASLASQEFRSSPHLCWRL